MKRSLALAVAFATLFYCPSPALAQTAVSLGAANSFAVLASSTVTNTGTSVITGDLGVSPGTAVTGFPPGIVLGGTIHSADATAGAAKNALTTAFGSLDQPCTADLTGQNLGGMTLTAGVYCFSSSAQLTGTLTLNAQGNANAVFIFKTGSTLTTASNASVVVINGGQFCNVFWRIGSSATLGTGTTFAGNILALASITLNTNARVTGRALAQTGAVTLDSNQVSVANCAAGPAPGCPTISLSPTSLPNGTRLVAYSQTITGSGGTAPYTFAIAAGALPTGLTLSAAGVLAGTPTTAGVFSFTVRGTDANGCFADLAYTITIVSSASCPPITISPATLPNGTVGAPVSLTFSGSGGTAPFTFTVSAGALPAGLTLSPSGVLSGTPTTAAVYSFTVRRTDALGCFAETPYTVTIITAVPTLSQWGALLLAAALLGLGYLRLRRRSEGAA